MCSEKKESLLQVGGTILKKITAQSTNKVS